MRNRQSRLHHWGAVCGGRMPPPRESDSSEMPSTHAGWDTLARSRPRTSLSLRWDLFGLAGVGDDSCPQRHSTPHRQPSPHHRHDPAWRCALCAACCRQQARCTGAVQHEPTQSPRVLVGQQLHRPVAPQGAVGMVSHVVPKAATQRSACVTKREPVIPKSYPAMVRKTTICCGSGSRDLRGYEPIALLRANRRSLE
jgi:hypothetical protein